MEKRIVISLFLCWILFGLSGQDIKVIIDADTGNEIDDILAITRALKADKLNVLGLTAEQWNHQLSWSKNTMQESWELNNRILESLNMGEIPSLKGSEMILGKPWGGRDPRKSEAADFIIEKAMEMPQGEKLIVLCTGAVTNVASAVVLKSEIIEKLAVYFVGTRYDFEKNAWNKNEFNVRNDLNAFDILLNTDGLELHILPANISGEIVFYAENTLLKLNSEVSIEDLILKRWAERVQNTKSWVMWDLGIIEALIHPEWTIQQTVDTPPENTSRKIYVYSEIDVEAMMDDFWKCLER
jgi:purine nucleosidase